MRKTEPLRIFGDCENLLYQKGLTDHTWAVQAIRSKKYTLQEIAKILGHSNLRMLIHHYAADIDAISNDAKDEIDIYDI